MTDLPWQWNDSPGAAATAKRVRHFARVTGLRPSRAYARVYGRLCSDDETVPAGADHTNVWRDGARYIVSTEPYATGREAKLEEWCALHGWDCRAVPELGMWNPPRTILYLLSPSKNGGDIERVLSRVAKAKAGRGRTP
jgi:hypothetical protein